MYTSMILKQYDVLWNIDAPPWQWNIDKYFGHYKFNVIWKEFNERSYMPNTETFISD